MSAKIRVLLVDDSVAVRKLLTMALSQEPDIDVVGAAATGAIALAKLMQSACDVVVSDVEMPDMSGLELLGKLRVNWPLVPVIMFSSLTQKAGAITIEAISKGAFDCVPKPTGGKSLEESFEQIRGQLVPKVRAAYRATALQSIRPSVIKPPVRSSDASPARPSSLGFGPVEAIAIGASTGGPDALAVVFASLGQALQVPIFVVQHMPPVFTRMLADRLKSSCRYHVVEAAHGMRVAPGAAYLAPGDFHMKVLRDGEGTYLSLDQGPAENSCRPSVDVLFRSMAAAYRAGSLAVVLTGMGRDGRAGAEVVVSTGGRVLAQDQASSVVWGMPGAVARSGLADRTLPIAEMGAEMIRRVTSAGARKSERGLRVS